MYHCVASQSVTVIFAHWCGVFVARAEFASKLITVLTGSLSELIMNISAEMLLLLLLVMMMMVMVMLVDRRLLH